MFSPRSAELEADEILAGIERRLIAMVDDRPFRFVDTRRVDADAHVQRMKRFVGYVSAEIEAAERGIGVSFPAVYRAYLRRMGRARGELFCGSDVARIDELAAYRHEAADILRASGSPFELPHDAIVYLIHQGYTFEYTIGSGAPDAPSLAYVEGEASPHRLPSLAARLVTEVESMELEHGRAHEAGGWYVTVDRGGIRVLHPARTSGERPLDRADRFRD